MLTVSPLAVHLVYFFHRAGTILQKYGCNHNGSNFEKQNTATHKTTYVAATSKHHNTGDTFDRNENVVGDSNVFIDGLLKSNSNGKTKRKKENPNWKTALHALGTA